MVRTESKSYYRASIFLTLSGLLLTGLISLVAQAQDENATCPCFSYEEVEGIFLKVQQLVEGQGEGSCNVTDYSVEFTAEVVVNDENYKTLARASVKWADFDPGQCDYRDMTVDPVVERRVDWPHPAPEATARACLDIISRTIEKLDSSGKCRTYP